jgi:hypothetical protein
MRSTVAERGVVTNARHAEFRAAQYIRGYIDRGYEIEPPFEDWEIGCHYPASTPLRANAVEGDAPRTERPGSGVIRVRSPAAGFTR